MTSGHAGKRTILAVLNYLGPMDQRPQNYPSDPARTKLNLVSHCVPVEDLSGAVDAARLDREGFELVGHRTSVSDFRVRDERDQIYRKEIEEMMLAVTGAAKVVVANGLLHRFAERDARFGAAGSTTPIRMIHADYSRTSGKLAADALLTPEERGRYRRSAGYSVWRALSPPQQDVPLAVCDARSVEESDWIGGDVVLLPPGRSPIEWEGSFYRYNPAHRWCCFSQMNRDQTLVFKTHDTDGSLAERAAHSAFDNPNENCIPRESVDIRVTAFFE